MSELAQPQQVESSDEPLAKMSFGDHLEELRKRLFLSLAAIFVCVVGMLPFKDGVSEVYLAPYRSMWRTGFADYVVTMEEKLKEAGGLEALAVAAEDNKLIELQYERFQFLADYKDRILSGNFEFKEFGDKIRSDGGFQVPYYLVAIGGIEDFWTFMAASFLFSLILASPFVLYQIWAFIAAGLYKHERGVVLRYLPLAVLLLVSGTSFGYFVVVPYGLHFLIDMMNFGLVQPMFSVSNYFSLLFMLTAALGFVFQLPLIMLALAKVGLVTHEGFKKNWRMIILGMFVVSAMFTPPDPFTQVMMGVPMVGLYGLGLLLTAKIPSPEAPPEATS